MLCQCECGKEVIVRADSLNDGNTKSCGCLRSEVIMLSKRTHGHAGRGKMTGEYKSWEEMKKRCTNPRRNGYKNYGGRGICIYAPWIESFQTFYDYVGPKPTKKHSLDRYPNTNGNYEPGNVRWGTDEQQSRNKRNNRWVEYNGEKMIVSDWAKRFNLKTVSSFISYMERHGIEKTFEHYKHKTGK